MEVATPPFHSSVFILLKKLNRNRSLLRQGTRSVAPLPRAPMKYLMQICCAILLVHRLLRARNAAEIVPSSR